MCVLDKDFHHRGTEDTEKNWKMECQGADDTAGEALKQVQGTEKSKKIEWILAFAGMTLLGIGESGGQRGEDTTGEVLFSVDGSASGGKQAPGAAKI